MSDVLSREWIRRYRLRNQLLTESSRASSAAAVVRKLGALQAQEWSSAQLAIAARTRGVTQADVKHARENERSFILTWSLRGTLHLVAAEDVAAQLAFSGPRAIRGTNRRYQQLRLDERAREQSLTAIAEILARDGALTRAELAQQLDSRDIPVAGQAIHHLVRHAALRGLICLGPERDGTLTYALLSQWLPDYQPVSEDEDLLPALARRYLAACGPAGPADFRRWTGASAKAAQSAFDAISAETVAVALPDGEALMLEEELDTPDQSDTHSGARFLPRYDNTLLAYASRDFVVQPAYAKRVHPGGGLIRACVIIDGEAAANWKLESRAKASRIVVSPFERLSKDQVLLLEIEAASLSNFLARDLEFRIDYT